MRHVSKLYHHLVVHHATDDEVRLPMIEIHNIIGGPPGEAWNVRSWWANEVSNHHSGKWIDAGFLVDEVDLDRKSALFRRGKP